jgi:molecular chaperone HscB
MRKAADGRADFFGLFDIPTHYRIDLEDLGRRYKSLISEIHPDRFSGDSEQTKRIAAQYSGMANEAYGTLSDPLKRGAYLVGLHGHDPFDELNTDMPGEFLMRQIELREAVDDADGNASALGDMCARLTDELSGYQSELGELLDDRQAWEEASGKLREMSYFVKILAEIERKLGLFSGAKA